MNEKLRFNKKTLIFEYRKNNGDWGECSIKFNNGILSYFDGEWEEWWELGGYYQSDELKKEVAKQIYLQMKEYYDKEDDEIG